MRYALFSVAGARYAVPLDKVLQMMPRPEVFALPLLKPLFSGVIVYRETLVPLVAERLLVKADNEVGEANILVVCEAEYGPVAFAAEQIDRITAPGEYSGDESEIEISDADVVTDTAATWHVLELNQLLEAPEGTSFNPG